MVDRNSCQHQSGELAGSKMSNLGKQPAVKTVFEKDELHPNKEVLQSMREILNKIGPHNIERVVQDIKELPIDTTERLSALADLIFEMAVFKAGISSVMASLCQILSRMSVRGEGIDDGKLTVRFRNLIINKCQKEFETNIREQVKSSRMEDISICGELERKLELEANWEYEDSSLRQRAAGNIQFIGELYKVRQLTTPIILRVIGTLLQRCDEESIGHLCTLLPVVGKILKTQCDQQERMMKELNKHFRKMQEIVDEGPVSDRVRLLLKDVVEKRDKGADIQALCDKQNSSYESWRSGLSRTCTTDQATISRPRLDPADDVLRVQYPRLYSGNAPRIEANPLGGYSNDSRWNFLDDQSMLHPIDRQYLPQYGKIKIKVNLDLNKAQDKFTDFHQRSETFRNLLLWMLNHRDCLVDPSSERLSVDFITYIGSLISIMKTPYNEREEWALLATEYKGTIYLINHQINEEVYSEKETDTEEKEVKEQTVDTAGLWGHTLEHILKGGNPEDAVDSVQAYRCIMKTSVGGHSILYAPKMDCVDPDKFEKDFQNMDSFISVKCCKEVKVEGQRRFQRRVKYNHWWIEHQLLGISRILVGRRNDSGIVHSLELLESDELPELARGEWDPNVSINFLLKFLEFVKKTVKRDCGWSYLFEYVPGEDIQCSKVGDRSYTLPSWFKDKIFKEETAKGSDSL